jgi:regulator of protease activity HflC (stomatin/prohibitin superfamily)
MTDAKVPGDARAQHVALVGFLLQLGAFGLLWGISIWSESDALAALAHLTVIGLPIWLVLYIVLNQIRRVGVEALETEEIRRAQEAGTGGQGIFELDEEALFLEQSRLKWMVRWLLPACSIAVVLLLLGPSLLQWDWSLQEVFDKAVFRRTTQPTLMMWFVVGAGFVCFLYSRYTLAAASAQPGWQLLRAGAVCMHAVAPLCVVMFLALMATRTIEWAEPLITYLARLAVIVLGVEFAMNFILDLYRPRAPGEVPRPSFDSRLLGMISEPGGIAKSIADAANYQFGFQVSTTWFYQFLQRWLFPVVVLALIAVFLLTSVVIVDAEEQAVIERFGRCVTDRDSVLNPGIYLKWPYPVEVVRRVPVRRLRERVVGETLQEDEEAHEEGGDQEKAVIWTEPHEFIPELMLLVAAPKVGAHAGMRAEAPEAEESADARESVAVSLLLVALTMEYRVSDILAYLYEFEDPERLLDAIAHRHLQDYAASIDIDAFMGPQREALNRELRQRIQAQVDELGMGIELAFVGMSGAHPTYKNNVANAFQGVISAQTSMAATIHAAEGEARRILTSVAGTVTRARALDEAIQAQGRLPAGSPELAEARRQVSALLVGDPVEGIPPAAGEVAAIIAEARGRASEWTTDVATRVRVFGAQVAAYRAAPTLYKQRKILEMYEEGLDNIRKYLVVGDVSRVLIEYEPFKEAGLDQVLSEGVEDATRPQ